MPKKLHLIGIAHIVVSAFKQAEERSAWIVRAYEADGQPTAASIHLPILDRSIAAKFGAAEIKTFLIPVDANQEVREVNLLEED